LSSSQPLCLPSSNPSSKVDPFPSWRKDTTLITLAQSLDTTLSTALMQLHTGYSEFGHNNTLSNTSFQARDHPDHDFYQKSGWAHSLIYLMVTYAAGTTAIVLTYAGLAQSNLLFFVIPRTETLFQVASYFLILVMLSTLLEDIRCAQGNVLRSLMGMTRKRCILYCKIFIFIFSLLGSISSTISVVDSNLPLYCLCANVAMYCMLAAKVYFTTVRHGNVFL
jgi:hypothetical protein